MTLDDAGVAFLVKEEGGFPMHPYWPGGASGVTIGCGFDCGYVTSAQFAQDWSALEEPTRNRLALVCGAKGDTARALVSDATIRSLIIPEDTAQNVFQNVSLPKYCAMTEGVYLNLGALCPAAQTALVSLVYNRGDSLVGDRRREMRAIVQYVQDVDYEGIAAMLEQMGTRLWPEQALEKRRFREAALVRSCES